jgi:hypothetical protein
MNRREFAGMLAGALAAPGMRATTTVEILSREVRYRADAQILLLSIPVFHRTGVGGGNVSWREWRDAGALYRLLEFTGYSLPEKAAGLNRLGFIREKSCRDGNALRESSYFGVMSASPEESAEEAHKALHSTAAEATYTAIQGRIAGAEIETASAHFNGPARLTPERRGELLTRAEEALSHAPRRPPEFHPSGAVPPPFLHALAEALRAPRNGETQYVYSGRLYRLSLRQSADAKATAYFRGRGAIGSGATVMRVAGDVRRESGGKETDFRLWVEQDAAQPVPLRIDFQPKSYLRLVMEAEA